MDALAKSVHRYNLEPSYNPAIPERVLLAALLERSYRDLKENVERKERRDAIRWFRGAPCRECDRDLEITFNYVKHVLELGSGQLDHIEKAVRRAEQMKYFIGIDPGISGALALLSDDGKDASLLKIPTVAGGTKYNINGYTLYTVLKNWSDNKDISVGLELIHSAPGQGVASMFSMGKNFGKIQGIIEALSLPFEHITPQKWKKTMIPSSLKGKDASVVIALQKFPHLEHHLVGVRGGRDHNIADALLIADYMRTMNSYKT